MARIKRPIPRRPAWWYPVGTTLTLRDGRVFRVIAEREKVWDDPSQGRGGGNWAWQDVYRWEEGK